MLNLILIAHGYPPIVIRNEEKDVYSKHIAHAQQYEENPVPLYEMLGNLLIQSYQEFINELGIELTNNMGTLNLRGAQ